MSVVSNAIAQSASGTTLSDREAWMYVRGVLMPLLADFAYLVDGSYRDTSGKVVEENVVGDSEAALARECLAALHAIRDFMEAHPMSIEFERWIVNKVAPAVAQLNAFALAQVIRYEIEDEADPGFGRRLAASEHEWLRELVLFGTCLPNRLMPGNAHWVITLCTKGPDGSRIYL